MRNSLGGWKARAYSRSQKRNFKDKQSEDFPALSGLHRTTTAFRTQAGNKPESHGKTELMHQASLLLTVIYDSKLCYKGKG